MKNRRHLSYANVMSTVAVILALVGGSTAVSIAGKKGKVKIPKGSVTSKSIKDGAVTAFDLAPTRAVQSPDRNASCAIHERLLSGGGGASRPEGLAGTQPNSFTSQPTGWTTSSNGSGPTVAAALCLSAVPGN